MSEDFSSGGVGVGAGVGGGGRGGRGPMRVDPRDRAQLELSPVAPRRILALFAPHRLPIAI